MATLEDPKNTVVVQGDQVTVTSVGAQGPQGISGVGDKHYQHIQASASSTWVIIHNLNKRPAVTVVDSTDREVEGEIVHDSLNQATITFTAAFAGKAYVN